MTRDTYLSIDMDFWCKYRGFDKVTDFFNLLKTINIKPTVVKYHHELVIDINKTKNVSRLINMDYHSDIADITICDANSFNEGTWVNYVRMNDNAEYIWRYPMNKCVSYDEGYCHLHPNHNPFNKHNQNKYHWTKVTRKHGSITHEELNRVRAVGICLSPNWTHTKHEYFVRLLNAHGYLNNSMMEKLMKFDKYESLKERQVYLQINENFLYCDNN